MNKPPKKASENRLLWTGLTVAILSLAGILVVLSTLAGDAPSPVRRWVFLVVAAQVPYGAALFLIWKLRPYFTSPWPVLAVSLFFRLILIPSPPLFSDDVYRYVWDGRVQQKGIDPYRHAPDAPELEYLRDGMWEKINHKPLRTIYPPLAETIFSATAFFAPTPTGFKLLSALADTAVVLLLIMLARRHPMGARSPQHGLWVGCVYGLHPLVCIETGMSGHLDPLSIAPMLAALLFLRAKRFSLSAVFVGIGAGIKLIPALLLPVLARRRYRTLFVFFVALGAIYLPHVSSGTNVVETLDAFARRWEGNAGIFAFLKWSIRSLIGWITGADNTDTLIHIPFLDPVARTFQDTFFSLHKDGGFDPMRPGAFTLGDISLAISKMICGAALLFTLVTVTIRRTEPVRATAWIMGILLLTTPVLHPWYLLWILPMAAILGHWPWFVLAGLAPLAYLPLDNWWAHGTWESPLWIAGVEYGVSAAALAAYILQKRWYSMETGPRGSN